MKTGTKVLCDVSGCTHNVDGECGRHAITIESRIRCNMTPLDSSEYHECSDYKPKKEQSK